MSLVNDFLNDELAGKSETTIKTYAHALKQFETYLKEEKDSSLDDFTRSELQDFIYKMENEGKQPATVNKIFQAICSFARFCDRPQVFNKVSIIKPAPPRAPKAIDKNDSHALIRYFEKAGNSRNYAILMVLLHTGIRISELCALNRKDVEISERKGMLYIRKGKGNKARSIGLTSEVRYALQCYLDERKDKHSALFVSLKPDRLTVRDRISTRTIQAIFDQYNIAKGYKRLISDSDSEKKYEYDSRYIHVHKLRHTFITRMVRSGSDITTIKTVSGHSSGAMIERYSLPTEEECTAAIEKAMK